MNNMGSINFVKDEQHKQAALTRINVRRLLHMLEDTKTRPIWFKDTKRSRQRWRHKQGGWNYNPVILKTYKEALAEYRKYEGALFAEAIAGFASQKGFMRRLLERG